MPQTIERPPTAAAPHREAVSAQGFELIDADAHVNPPPTFWDAYLPASLAGRGPQIEVGDATIDHDWVVFEGSRKPLNIMSSVVQVGRNFRPSGRQSDIQAGSWEPAARLLDMDRDGAAGRWARRTTISISPVSVPITAGWPISAATIRAVWWAWPICRCRMWRSPSRC
jgi:hypothetical protein